MWACRPCVLTWSRGRPVRLHQLHLGHLLSVLLADVVLLGHERVVERRLAHGAEAVGVVAVFTTTTAATTTACRCAAGILCWFLPGLDCCWCLKGYWKPTIPEKGRGNWGKKKKDGRSSLLIHTWRLWLDGLQPQVLGVNFALVVRLGHHGGGELHVTYMTNLRFVRVSVVAV